MKLFLIPIQVKNKMLMVFSPSFASSTSQVPSSFQLQLQLHSAIITILVPFSAILSSKVLIMLLLRQQYNRIQLSSKYCSEVLLSTPFFNITFSHVLHYFIFFPGWSQSMSTLLSALMLTSCNLNSAFRMCCACSCSCLQVMF